MSRPDYQTRIEERIASFPEGNTFITSDFLDIADTQVVNKALSRMAEVGTIRRILRGIYDRPRYSELLKEWAAPKVEEVAKAIARNFGWTIVPCGDTALNLLGLSTQVPAVWSYISNGPYRSYQIGKTNLEFKHTANRDIDKLSPVSALVVQALKALGKGNIGAAEKRKLSAALTEGKKACLVEETQHSTAWIFETVKEICELEKAE